MRIPILDLHPQINSLRSEINEAISRVIDRTDFIMGGDVKEFEKEVAAFLGVKHAIGVNSGTDALVIALRAAGIGVGDEVITTPFSFFATAESISIVGATPVFVDIHPSDFNIDTNLIEEAITPRTRAIVPVHLYGGMCGMTRIMEIAQRYDLKVIEDCAQSFGAQYYGTCSECNQTCNPALREVFNGKRAGTIGDIGCFSFFPSKNLGAFGDGGLITTDDDSIALEVQRLHLHGAIKKYHNEVLGYNSRLDTIQAAILRVKLPYTDVWNTARYKVANRYNGFFDGIEGIGTPKLSGGHVFHQYTIRVLNGKRDIVQSFLAEKGIGSMVYYPVPQDQLPVYRGQYAELSVSNQLKDEVLSLPIWPEIDVSAQKEVVDSVIEAITA